MNLKSEARQNIQLRLAFSSEPTGEARQASGEETESLGAMNEPESPARTDRLMEEVCERENLKEALRRVKTNKGSAGIDGMRVVELTGYLKEHWPGIREQLLSGTYKPKAATAPPLPDQRCSRRKPIVARSRENLLPARNKMRAGHLAGR